MSKLKLFVENFLAFGLGGIINGIAPFIMIPIVTRFMPDTSYYGITDLSNTLVQFGRAFASMGMFDAMFRLFFDKDDKEYQKAICSTAFTFVLIASAMTFIVMILFRNHLAFIFFNNPRYAYIIYIVAISTLVGAINSIVAAPTRMQNKRKQFLLVSTINPIITYAISLSLLFRGYYIVALPIAGAIAITLTGITFWILNRDWFEVKRFRFDFLKRLIPIALPIVPNLIIYWTLNSSGKIMITNILGTHMTGIFSVGLQLGQASQLIYLAFAGGWQYFAFSTMREENQEKTNSLIFEYLSAISFVCSMFIFTLARNIYNLLFVGDFIKGYSVAPYLFMAPLLLMLFQVAGSQFVVIKKTWPPMVILLIGVGINIALNLLLIPRLGIEGAGIAILIGYIISVAICVFVLTKMKLFVITYRLTLSVCMMTLFILLWRFFVKESLIGSICMTLTFSALYIYLYRKEVKFLVNIIVGIK